MLRIKRAVFWLGGVLAPPVDAASRAGGEVALTAGMDDVLADLRCEAALISDYPRAWLDRLQQQTPLSAWFAPGQIFMLPDVAGPGALDGLVAAGALAPGSDLLIDRDPVRTLAALRRGIDVSIFVSPARLYRDLWLWGLLPAPEPPRLP